MNEKSVQNNDNNDLGESPRTMEFISVYAALFASLTTLLCCALPAFLVLLGFGFVAVLSFFTAIPGWESFGIYEIWYFAASGAILILGFYLVYFRSTPVCDVPASGRGSACSLATRWNRTILWLSLSLYVLALVLNFWGIPWMRTQGYFNH